MSNPPAPLSTWARNVSPSPTLAVDARAKALQAAGEDVCGFAAGEPDFDTPDHIKEACIAALKSGKTKYAPTPGIEPLRQAIVDRYLAEYGLKAAPSQVIVSPGGKFNCFLGVLATCSPGDEVIVPAPYWVSYPEMVKLAGATPKFVLADDRTGFRLTPAMVESAITPRTKLLILNSPSNPTGAVYSRQELEAIVAVALKHNLYILSDEMYEHLVYDGAKPTCIATFSKEAEARTITVAGFSKTYAMTGWRIGTTLAPAPIAKAISELQSQMSSNVTTFAQYGALAALKEKEKDRRVAQGDDDGLRSSPEISARRTQQDSRHHLPARGGRILSFPQHLELRSQGSGFLQPPARCRESRRRSWQRIRRRGLPAAQLRDKRRDHPEGCHAPCALLCGAEKIVELGGAGL